MGRWVLLASAQTLPCTWSSSCFEGARERSPGRWPRAAGVVEGCRQPHPRALKDGRGTGGQGADLPPLGAPGRQTRSSSPISGPRSCVDAHALRFWRMHFPRSRKQQLKCHVLTQFSQFCHGRDWSVLLDMFQFGIKFCVRVAVPPGLRGPPGTSHTALGTAHDHLPKAQKLRAEV